MGKATRKVDVNSLIANDTENLVDVNSLIAAEPKKKRGGLFGGIEDAANELQNPSPSKLPSPSPSAVRPDDIPVNVGGVPDFVTGKKIEADPEPVKAATTPEIDPAQKVRELVDKVNVVNYAMGLPIYNAEEILANPEKLATLKKSVEDGYKSQLENVPGMYDTKVSVAAGGPFAKTESIPTEKGSSILAEMDSDIKAIELKNREAAIKYERAETVGADGKITATYKPRNYKFTGQGEKKPIDPLNPTANISELGFDGKPVGGDAYKDYTKSGLISEMSCIIKDAPLDFKERSFLTTDSFRKKQE